MTVAWINIITKEILISHLLNGQMIQGVAIRIKLSILSVIVLQLYYLPPIEKMHFRENNLNQKNFVFAKSKSFE